ncbi:hypothetical protein BC834DRAFT_154204 [Gloeopeniophorella convolvens]|nr:hypothetical protein BC834DRAFT_154204 [Gloeopeniophorella convolvens]
MDLPCMGSPSVVPSPPHRECGELLIQGDFLVDVRSDKSWPGQPGWSYFDMSKQPGGAWIHVDLESDVCIAGWALDVSQDLIAVALTGYNERNPLKTRFLHFTSGMRYSISTCTPELELVGKCESKFSVQMELVRTRLFVLVAHGSIPRRRESLYLVDRTQGRVNCVRHASRGTYFPVLTFISEDTLVLGQKRDWALEVCQVTAGKHHGTHTLQTLCILKLPSYLRSIRADLAMSRKEGYSQPTARSTLPFRSNPHDAVLSFKVELKRKDKTTVPRDLTCHFFILPKMLRKLAGVGGPATSMDPRLLRSAAPNVAWKDWGPDATRWLRLSHSRVLSLGGTRCAYVGEDDGTLHVLDFNQPRTFLNAHYGHPGAIIRGKVFSRQGSFFSEDVMSRLPFLWVKDNGHQWTGERSLPSVLIGDAWVVHVEVCLDQVPVLVRD